MAATARERLEDFVALFENPEISALAAISRILEELPDEASRLRVMRWAFGKYGEEFKRPLPEGSVVATPAAPAAAPLAPVAKLTRPVVTAAPPSAPPKPTIVPSVARSEEPTAIEPADFDRQVAELNDLFGDRPDGLRLAKPRQG